MRLLFFSVFILLMCDFTRGEIMFIAERMPLKGNRPNRGSPWPLPQHWHNHAHELFTFKPNNLTFSSNLESCDLIHKTFHRLVTNLRRISRKMREINENLRKDLRNVSDESSLEFDSENLVINGEILTFELNVQSAHCPKYPQNQMKEDYNITVSAAGILVQATEIWGIIRGMETVKQLMYTIDEKWLINGCHVHDWPRFSYRGLHLDTGRHFYPVDILKTNLDAMSSSKFNVFHWHIVDAQSFPYQSIKYPELTKKGAFSPHHVYSQNDVAQVIEYARLRGIRVIPEFDSPGHAHSWGMAKPELLTPCWSGGKAFQANYSYHAKRENFDPSKNYTFEFLADFYDELKSVFKDDFLHVGMDEAHYMCWESSPNISQFMMSIGLNSSDYPGLEQYYNNRLLQIVEGVGKRTIAWQDPTDHGALIPNMTIIQMWKNHSMYPLFLEWQEYLRPVLASGYNVIFSSCWYMNHIKYGQQWKDFYTCDPTTVAESEKEKSQIIGGEVCAWSEYLDETNILQNFWPRASAAAERLWSSPDVVDTDSAAFRLDQHRCRLNMLDIPAQPILPGYCRSDYNTDNAERHQSQADETTARTESDMNEDSQVERVKEIPEVSTKTVHAVKTNDQGQINPNGTLPVKLSSVLALFCLIFLFS